MRKKFSPSPSPSHSHSSFPWKRWSGVELKLSEAFGREREVFLSEVHLTPKSAAKTRNEHARSRSVGNNDEIGNTNVIIVGGGNGCFFMRYEKILFISFSISLSPFLGKDGVELS